MMTICSPFQAELFTNFVPTDKDREHIRSLCIEPLQELERLDAEIKRLTEHRNELKTFLDAHHALLSPMRRLSPEILQTIFVECLSHPPYSSYPVLANSDAPLLLGRVCSSWRQIAYGCAMLWSSIHIAIPDPRTSDEEALLHRLRLEATTEWLKRSGALPLHISIFGRLNRHAEAPRITNAEQCDWVTPYAEALLRFASRWKTLDIAVPLCYLQPWNNLTGQQVPLLQNIQVVSTDETWGPIFTRSSNSLHFLSEASLDSLNIPHLNEVPKFNKGSLTHLTITDAQSFANTEEMVSFFSGFTNLKDLSFSLPRFYVSLPQPSAQTHTLPCLEYLSLQHDGQTTWLITFWEAFHLPKLRRVNCGMLPSPLPRNIAAFGRLMNGSSQCFFLNVDVMDTWTEATNRSVARSGTPWSTEDLSSYLRQCPSVTNLSVTCWSKKDMGETLCRAIFLDGDGPCLPRLEILSISLFTLPLVENNQLLHQALNSRAQWAHSHPEICAPLKTLTINVHTSLPRDFDTSVFSGLQNYGTSFTVLFPQNVKKSGSTRTSAFDKGWELWEEPPKLKFP
jgi:hypothetical protein